MSNKALSGNTLAEHLRRLLPPDWVVRIDAGSAQGPDALLEVLPPSGERTVFAVELKSRFEPRDVDYAQSQLARYREQGNPLLFAPRLSERSRLLLRDRGISYADTIGNLRIWSTSMFIEHRHDDEKSADREAHLRTSLRGPVTGRLIRYLIEAPPPLRIREIAHHTSVNPGNVSRLAGLLERDRLITRDERGTILAVDWEALIREWSQDLKKERHVFTLLEPHGIDYFVRRLDGREPYALTGSYAAALLAPVAVPGVIDLHVKDPEQWIERLRLPQHDVGNVRLIEAFDDAVFDRMLKRNGMLLANPSQIAADILTFPQRSSEEYDSLISWMKVNEHVWRLA